MSLPFKPGDIVEAKVQIFSFSGDICAGTQGIVRRVSPSSAEIDFEIAPDRYKQVQVEFDEIYKLG